MTTMLTSNSEKKFVSDKNIQYDTKVFKNSFYVSQNFSYKNYKNCINVYSIDEL